MSKSLVYNAVKREFPYYRVINVFEIGMPVFKKSAKCLATIEKGLPIVQEYTLKLSNLNYSTIEISEMLALDKDLVKSAYYSLIQLDLIDFKTRKITEKGREALNKSKYSSLEITEVSLSINSYTGNIYKSGSFIKAKNTNKMNLFTIKPLLSKNDQNLVDYTKVRSIFKSTKKEEDAEFDGNLVEISRVVNKADEFYKLYIVILESPDKEIRLLAYDLDYHLETLELKLKQGDLQGIKYFITDSKFLEEMYALDFLHSVEISEVDFWDILDVNILESDYNQLEFILPINDYFIPNDGWIDALSKLLKSKTKVIITFTGNYSNPYQKVQVNKIINLKRSTEFLNVNHSIERQLPTLCINKSEGFIIKPSCYNLDLVTNSKCMETKVYKITEFKEVEVTERAFDKEELLNKQSLKKAIKELVMLIKDLDLLMNDYYGMGWLINNRCNNEHLFESMGLANNLNSFTTFTAQLYGCIGEIIKELGDKENKRGYFFNDFKERVPHAQNAMNRLRVYRNSVQHSHLDDNQIEIYLDFIKQDLNGTFPEFIDNGYLILQSILIKELIKNVKEEIGKIKFELQEMN
ncbi:hypothetical protein MKY41_19210 [Sporosarcina sp. FSL W7-1349]|uniref:hypothetical protein n=1 Tax=Sporosarcina sp. FSL W7-1349 TaxID=2921561 RepID=UPI0030FA235B